MPKYIRFSICTDFCFLVALGLFLLPIQWVLGWILATLIHEVSHILMIKILRIRIISISLHSNGMVIETEEMTSFQEILCAIAGPLGGLGATVLLKVIPQVAICAVLQSTYNLIPVYPLDGGRALKSATICIGINDKVVDQLLNIVSVAIVLIFTSLGLWLTQKYKLGILPVVFPTVPLIFTVYKNSLQSRGNDSRIFKYLSRSERNINR